MQISRSKIGHRLTQINTDKINQICENLCRSVAHKDPQIRLGHR
jgi:hypothetical protein